ncbi:PAS domain S-box-containing protein [Klenkia marina]|uniref:PAS domain S-box-containing protein n=1 Tax=Klenkia marina TaxID=1960309 RepID=A0A1G4XIR0_9ACTN|nr:SpoIIE family protein phosphatase [Klenkia marina]SCX41076.1 PAS domain S-box-containing protein [Klenkia marina]
MPAGPEVPGHREADLLRRSLAVDSGQVGSFDWDLASGRLVWDERLHALFGYRVGEFGGTIEAFDARVHPADRERVTQALRGAIDSCGRFEAEYRVVLPDGTTRWVQAKGRALAGADPTRAVRVLGAAYDTTDVRDGQTRTTRLLEAMPAGFFSLDAQWRFTFLNSAAERLLGQLRGELLGRSVWETFPDAVGSDFETAYRGAVESGQPQTFEAHYPAPLDAWYDVLAWPAPDGLAVYFSDITHRKRAAASAGRAAARAALRAQVTNHLADASDTTGAVADVARLLVPTLADGAIVTLLAPDGRPEDVGHWHVEPAHRAALAAWSSARLDVLPVTSPLATALRDGTPVHSSTAAVAELLPPGPDRTALEVLAADDLLVLPIPGRGRVLGALTLFTSASRPLRGVVQDTAADLAARMGLALVSSRLVAAQGQIAESLQRSLLTDPPHHDQAEIVVRYVPAAESARVGGDWYDVFRQHDGSTVLVIGDVVGHDLAAAAAMGQLRGLLRGIATSSDVGPAEVLRRLDASMRLLGVDTLATAVVARLEQPAGHPGTTRLTWSNAGHPAPLLIHPDGRQTVLDVERGELLLGVDDRTSRTERVRTLEPGTTVLLHSDGLTERRDSTLDAGLERLQRALAELHGSPLDALCDGVIDRLVDGRPDDDVALVAVRLS